MNAGTVVVVAAACAAAWWAWNERADEQSVEREVRDLEARAHALGIGDLAALDDAIAESLRAGSLGSGPETE